MAQAGSESGIVDTVHLIDRYIITCRYGSFFGALDLDACGPSKCGCAFGKQLRERFVLRVRNQEAGDDNILTS